MLTNWAKQLSDNPKFQGFIIALIIFNGIILGFETSKTIEHSFWGQILHVLDQVCLWVFVFELVVAMIGYRLAFLKDPWRIFDTIVVGIAFAPAGGSFSVLRGLRILRVLRLFNAMPSLKRIISAMVGALPGMMSICSLLVIVYYVAAVMATKLFGEAFPEWFGTLGHSLYTLFQVMTLESWSMGIVRPVMEKFPYAWLFFLPFIMLATFTMLNLFVGVLVSAMQEAGTPMAEQMAHEEEMTEQLVDDMATLEDKIQGISNQLNVLHQELQLLVRQQHAPQDLVSGTAAEMN